MELKIQKKIDAPRYHSVCQKHFDRFAVGHAKQPTTWGRLALLLRESVSIRIASLVRHFRNIVGSPTGSAASVLDLVDPIWMGVGVEG